jgi:outer membrane protein assembly factor BamB
VGVGRLDGQPDPSPVYSDGLVILMSGYRGNSLKAVRLADAKGDITNTPAVVWTFERDIPYVPSPLLYDRILYFFLKGNTGVLSAFDAESGKPHYQLQRIDGVPNVFASPVGADGKLIVLGQDGSAAVLKHGPSDEVLATNQLDDKFDASPALVDGDRTAPTHRVSSEASPQTAQDNREAGVANLHRRPLRGRN